MMGNLPENQGSQVLVPLPLKLFGDLHPVILSPGMKISYLQNKGDSIMRSTDIF